MNVLTLVALFGAGVSSVLAPCVLPLLPAYVTVMIDAASRGAGAAVVRSGLEFVAGFTAVFVGLGAATGALGAAAGTVGATADLLARVGGGVLVGMALLMLLAGRTRTGAVHRLLKRMPQAGSRWRPLLLGVGFGAAWTPCVGPLLGSALVIAAGSGPAAGAVLLTAYSLGLAVPFLCLCLAVQAGSDPLRGLAARFGQAALAWHRVAACLVLVLGAALASGRTPLLVASVASS